MPVKVSLSLAKSPSLSQSQLCVVFAVNCHLSVKSEATSAALGPKIVSNNYIRICKSIKIAINKLLVICNGTTHCENTLYWLLMNLAVIAVENHF